MEWTLAGLFGVSVLLLIISLTKTAQATKAQNKGIDLVHVEVMKEINDLQESIRNIELDIEVVMNEAGVELSPKEKVFMREILDLYKRNYSIESIAERKQVSAEEIKELLAPYLRSKDERRSISNAG
ncbi:hypothetical protein IEC97_24645 [Neobacillus cucumis]|uniref:DUF2802 domain-containing protein n=2 Tax=Bacillus salipaludis TaxID=2547811 RepID=A0A4R5VR87_9BACI|nr:hypothetical protein [Neobacillus cucumis]MBI0580539.1 hypothetical protein [Neobacillus cucumis]TDK61103.1 hypothetical protein E2K98_14730 [Bacillus salipaludis]WHY89417.1 hypothetical protein QNK12_17085 [Neobacillus cucumis]